MFLVNSRYPHSLRRPRPKALLLKWHPFSRSYRANLPSSLTTILSSTLGFSSRLPVSVYGTVSLAYTRAFSCHFLLTIIQINKHNKSENGFPLFKGRRFRNILQEFKPDSHRLRLSASP